MAHGGHQPRNNRFQPSTLSPSSGAIDQQESLYMDNAGIPYFLHGGDHPRLVLVSHSLTGPNFNTWSKSMLMALNAKHNLGLVDGSIPKASIDDDLLAFWPLLLSFFFSVPKAKRNANLHIRPIKTP